VGEIRQWQELNPVILLVVAEGAEILFHGLILALGLAVGLWVEGGR
jgi:hypothetical protein